MKCSIPEISWHNREPVLSVDIHPLNQINNDFYRLATGGSDNLVLIWKLKVEEDGRIEVSVLSELTRHQRSVNVVKWSPNGDMLASGDDDANIILWQLKTDGIPSLDDHENEFEERWNVYKVLRGHKEDVYDLCWSPKSDRLLSGSVDNTAILWDVQKGKSDNIIRDHKGFIQGVAWDPKNQYIATLSSDRICRVFDDKGKRVRGRIARGTLPVAETDELYDKEVKYFHDDTFKTYFRRLTFTPDGSLLLVPSGAVETEDRKNALFGTFAFTLDSLNKPVCIIPSGKQCSIVVKCCPLLFELRETGPKPLVDLPYRMIIAIATDSDVVLYDTQQHAPCAHLQNIHYTRLTDLTWSSDGLLLAASSTDGFITLVTFEEGELGTPYVKEESEEDSVMNVSGCDKLPEEEEQEQTVIVEEPKIVKEIKKKPSFLEQWAKQGPVMTPQVKRKSEVEKSEDQSKKLKIDEVVEVLESPEKSPEVPKIKDLTVELVDVIKYQLKTTELKEVNETEIIKEGTPLNQTKKRITPLLISKDTSKLPKVDKEKEETKTKRRIQPTKIAEPKLPEQNRGSNSNSQANVKAKTIEKEVAVTSAATRIDVPKAISLPTSTLNDVQETTPKKVPEIKKTEKLEKQVIDVNILMQAKPSTIKTKTGNTPTSSAKKPKRSVTPHDTKKASTSANKKKPTPTNTLFNYLKPLASNSKKTNELSSKSEFKPQNLFASKEKEETPKESHDAIKVKTSSLFKTKSVKSDKVEESEKIVTVTDDTMEAPEDFVLAIEDTDDESEIIKTNTEVDIVKDGSTIMENGKENNLDIETKEEECKVVELAKDLKIDVDSVEYVAKTPKKTPSKTLQILKDSEIKQPRRIPLITLSSPKNKKKIE